MPVDLYYVKALLLGCAHHPYPCIQVGGQQETPVFKPSRPAATNNLSFSADEGEGQGHARTVELGPSKKRTGGHRGEI